MATNEIIFGDYLRRLRCSAQAVPVLSARLHKVAPIDITLDEKRMLKVVGVRCDDVQRVQSERERFSPLKIRPLLIAFGSGWAAGFEVLGAAARYPRELGRKGEKAAAMQVLLFPQGLSFTQLDAESAWGEGQRRLERIRDEGLADELNELIGAEYVQLWKHATQALGDALGTGRARPVPSSTALVEALSRFGQAVGAYCRVLAASVDEDDPKSVERFMKAVTPIDMHRAAVGRGGSVDADEEEEVVTPVVTVASPAANDAPVARSTTLNGVPAPTTLNGVPAPTTLNGAPAPTPTTLVGEPAPQRLPTPTTLVA